MCIFRDRTFKEIIKWGHTGGALILSLVSLKEEETTDPSTPTISTEEKQREDTARKVYICNPGREPTPETNLDNTMILDFWPPDYEKINFV